MNPTTQGSVRRLSVRLGLAAAVLAVASFAGDHYVAPVSSPATGPSWLSHLGRSFDKSALGRIGGLGPRQQDPELQAPAPAPGVWLRDGLEAHGADLFRYSCRACHGAQGIGQPPEILSLVAAIRRTSAELQAGRAGGATQEAARIAAAADRLIRHRLAAGGTSMPAFDYLADDEAEVLLGYLEKLAAIPDPRHVDRPLRLPVDRVGEQIVKGNCQICHDARADYARLGSDPSIHPLATMTQTIAVADFVRAARHRGAGLSGRGPEATYLRDEELQAVYFYLAAFPPR
ncbi:MAG: c-type cytochrome [Thermoanaerobaculia bacterium]